MSIALQGRLTLDLLFNGKPFPFNETQDFVFLHISESVHQVLPMLSVCVKDNSRWLATNGALSDGVKITVVIDNGSDSPVTRRVTFRKSAHKEQPSLGEKTYQIDGYLDVPRYMTYAPQKPARGTSSAVLEQIAKDCQLKFTGVGSNDAQVWYPMARPLFRFARELVDHGYVSDTSCMQMAVTSDGSMVYRDVTAMDQPVVTFSPLGIGAEGSMPIMAAVPEVNSGGANWLYGYGQTMVEQSLTGDNLHVINGAVGTTINEGGKLQVNSALKSEQARVVPSGIQSGNAHDKYMRAAYQNRRVSGLFNVEVAISVPVLTNVRVLDTVTLQLTSLTPAEGESARAYNGQYRALRKVTYVTPGFAVEKFMLVRRTVAEPASVATSSPASISPQETVKPLAVPVKPTATTGGALPFDPVQAATLILGTAQAAIAAVQATSQAAMSALGKLSVKLSQDRFMQEQTSLQTNITNIVNAGVEQLNQLRPNYPGDTFGVIANNLQTLKDSVQTAITDATPWLQQYRLAALALAESAATVLLSPLTTPNAASTASAQKTMASQLKMARGDAAAQAAVASATEQISTAVASTNDSLTQLRGAVQTQRDNLFNSANDLNATLDNMRTAAFASLQAASGLPA